MSGELLQIEASSNDPVPVFKQHITNFLNVRLNDIKLITAETGVIKDSSMIGEYVEDGDMIWMLIDEIHPPFKDKEYITLKGKRIDRLKCYSIHRTNKLRRPTGFQGDVNEFLETANFYMPEMKTRLQTLIPLLDLRYVYGNGQDGFIATNEDSSIVYSDYGDISQHFYIKGYHITEETLRSLSKQEIEQLIKDVDFLTEMIVEEYFREEEKNYL
jgi:hypothetical protein